MRLPWRKKADVKSVVDPIDRDQVARLNAAKAAATRTQNLLNKAREQTAKVEDHLREMDEVGSKNHFADLIRDYAFRTR